ncbi:aconitase/3-isopropylmalate dehydratase large subunit family protein [Acidobacteriota bacterium]
MGYTVIEKILQGRSSDDVQPGNVIWLDLDIRSARDFGGPNVVKNFEGEYGESPVEDPQKTFFTFDLCVPACSIRYANNQQICRVFAKKQGMTVFDVDQGIGSHVLIEQGLAAPGSTVVGTDSHLNILGAVNCFGQGMGDVDITFAFRTGKTWFEVPESIKVVIHGRPSPSAKAKDLTLFILKELGTQKGALRSIEFYGEAVKSLNLAGRITLCSMVTEMAGIVGFIPQTSEAFQGEMNKIIGHTLEPLEADPDAAYADVIEIDVEGLESQAAAPFLPTNVCDVSELEGTPIDSGFLGSCTNGRMEDFEEAARVLRGRRVKEGIMLKMVPATRRVYEDLIREGLLPELFRSGAIISNPGCGGCAEGHIGLTGEGEVQVSTGNRNFAGKQGKGQIYLAGPAVVAASCVAGHITRPENLG